MANIKITELNELTSIATDDVLPIVDTSANETKKMNLKEILNVELIAVADTAPSTCSTGDKYFNATTNLIYTATNTNTWGSTGVSAIKGILYIVTSTNIAYSYNGTTLVGVSGANISNTYGTSQENGYSQNYINNLQYERITPADLITLNTGFSFGETNIFKYKNHYTGTITILKNAKFTSNQETIGTIAGTIPSNINTYGVSGTTVDDRWSIPTNFAYIYINNIGSNTVEILMRGKTTDAYVKFNIDIILN